MRIGPVRTPDDLQATAALFEAYARSLPIDLGYQDFAVELASLPGKYAPPRGELLLARDAAGQALGCVGLRPLAAEGCCEMKRLYLAPEARGTGLGRALAQAIVGQARKIGYSELRLDTLATMTSAIGLYGQMGFAEVGPYYAPTPPGTVFMALWL
ncbi:GNAT family N-acetyltransferase [Phenylobacterium sp.]|uniref:GNAT family N-acetyltransferase n=1 Tax=Phenylobacterium sp. TaxID=1871053 RepID=UPI0027347609|nr:GNAT family N-acetyltransferase [Phenylobacterium sp.]MDP3852081.1 GNAT family N-acetyltransferase [Phenylobacterium sp.]